MSENFIESVVSESEKDKTQLQKIAGYSPDLRAEQSEALRQAVQKIAPELFEDGQISLDELGKLLATSPHLTSPHLTSPHLTSP